MLGLMDEMCLWKWEWKNRDHEPACCSSRAKETADLPNSPGLYFGGANLGFFVGVLYGVEDGVWAMKPWECIGVVKVWLWECVGVKLWGKV
jgi:hypothetical protein